MWAAPLARDFINLDCHGQTPAHLRVRSSAPAMTRVGWECDDLIRNCQISPHCHRERSVAIQ